MAKNKKTKKEDDGIERVVSENRKARHDYDVLESLECGIELVGSEVKSLRCGTVSLAECYARVKKDEVFLVNCDIPEYIDANRFNHKRKRDRKLLLHRREIERFAKRALEKGLTLVPLKLYFKNGRAKLLVGLCRGKQNYDKRQALKKADVERGLRQMKMFRR
ncbi:MAG: SsrA-binding protein SmpB [Thermoguttaceae bacterium]|jgi:SsrA-binding protein|nr:SsrA-binding protein SmpB [Thermoguttaceae bacterium]MBQ2851301.1 SsrA-binding protein SmpB [Thermoguttaceae bacterium]MBQ7029194.1 SsrA-binding protein SmpB [Thermoguttaceae bacterium]MBQ7111693.1 SsrA-binding protein SmpB [Thermoguttaceae bacterium]MBQ7814680.1 SsrA-binding protein SmpB [Thermoguttaceae bacterium]